MRISDWSSDVCSCRSGQGVFLTLVLKLKHCSLRQAQRMGVFGSKGDMRRRTAFGDSRRLHAQFVCAKYVLPGDQVDTACPGLERLGLFGKEWGPGVAGGFIAGWDWVIAINGYEPLAGVASVEGAACFDLVFVDGLNGIPSGRPEKGND